MKNRKAWFTNESCGRKVTCYICDLNSIAHSSVFQVKRLALRLPKKRLQIEYTPKRGSK